MSKLTHINGIPVQDAKRNFKVDVLPVDIKSASIKQPGNCAVARACKRELGVTEALVHLTRVYLLQGNRYIRYEAPRSMRDEIIAFDRGGRFEPTSFVLKPVPQDRRLGRKRQGGTDDASYKKTGRKRSYHRTASVREAAVLEMRG